MGYFFRRTSLKELPELINILEGDSDIIETTKKNLDKRVSMTWLSLIIMIFPKGTAD